MTHEDFVQKISEINDEQFSELLQINKILKNRCDQLGIKNLQNEFPRRKQRGIPVLTMLVFKTKLVDLGEFVDIPFLSLGFLHTA